MSKKNKNTKSFTCCLCNDTINLPPGWGNNPYPLFNEGENGQTNPRCCDFCNATKVIPARLGIKPPVVTKEFYQNFGVRLI